MRSFSGPQQAILNKLKASKRTFFLQNYIDAADAPQVLALWDGDHALSASTEDAGPFDFIPMAGLADLTTIRQTQVSDMSIPGQVVTFPGILTTPFAAIVSDPDTIWHQQAAEIHIGLFAHDAPTVLVGDLIPWFYGFLDKVTLTDEPAGGTTTMKVYFEGIAREMSRNNLSVRSDLDQRERDSNDRGYETIGAEKNWNWGGIVKEQEIRRSKRIERRGARGDT